ncbi:uncharacterized protein LOC117786458 [Drosophila innubila]|uniref:uncharacterized protein LOC117786458 n=1 Tax=Drosophila innubila TaxID=198719 RepID=UPI00148E6017|nr:uncharacterized protein LOC117786458 [Drosophila innubila]
MTTPKMTTPKKTTPKKTTPIKTIPKINKLKQTPNPIPEALKEVQLELPKSPICPVNEPAELIMNTVLKPKPTVPKMNIECNPKPTGLKKTTEFKHKPLVLKKNPEPILKPLGFKRNTDLDSLPTTEEIWDNFEKWKMGGEAIWPLNCQQNMSTSAQVPVIEIEDTTSPKKVQICDDEEQQYQDQVDEAVKSLLDWEESYKVPEMPAEFESFDNFNFSFAELGSIDLSLEEERNYSDFLKSQRLHEPLSNIKEYNSLLKLARSEEGRKALHERVKKMKIAQLMQKKKCKCSSNTLISEESKVKETKQIIREQPVKKLTAETVKLTVPSPIVEVKKVQNIAIGSVIDLPPKAQIKDVKLMHIGKKSDKAEKPVILNAGNAQQRLKQFGQNPSQVVKTKIHAMPPKNQTPSRVVSKKMDSMSVAAQLPIGSIITFPQPMALGKANCNIQQLKVSGIPVKELQFPTSAATQIPQIIKTQPQAIAIPNIKDLKISEKVEPQNKRDNTNEAGPKNFDHLKRIIVMPALRRFADPRMKNILILRPPKVKGERAKLEIEVKSARTFSTMQLNIKLDLKLLALVLDNTFYNAEIHVLMKRCEDVQVAWIWEDGSIVICNSRTVQLLSETENSLVSKILAVIKPPSSFTAHNRNTLHCNTINTSKLPWKIAIEKFCQNFSLTPEAIMSGSKYGYYVNKTLPRIAAKLYDSGMVHIISATPAGVDKMLEKLYVFTADDTINVRITTNTNQPPPKPSFFGESVVVELSKRLQQTKNNTHNIEAVETEVATTAAAAAAAVNQQQQQQQQQLLNTKKQRRNLMIFQ